MAASEASVITLSVGSNVLLVAQTQLLDCLLNRINAAIISHRLGAETNSLIQSINSSLIEKNESMYLKSLVLIDLVSTYS